jgi:hypothetical protein
MTGQRVLKRVFSVYLLMLFSISACNVYDFLYEDYAESENVERMLKNADSALVNAAYADALGLFGKVLAASPSNSRAMVGYAASIILENVYVQDIPVFLNAILQLGDAGGESTFVESIVGKPGMSFEVYRSNVQMAFSNAAFYRSAVIGVDSLTGIITVDGDGFPAAADSDNVIPPTDRTVLLNYLVTKTVHIAMVVQDRFRVAGNLLAGIDVASYTNNFALIVTEEGFTNFHLNFTNDVRTLSNVYISMTNAVLNTGDNISAYNLLDVGDVYIHCLANAGLRDSMVSAGSNIIYNLKLSIEDLMTSMTNAGSGILDGFDQLTLFRTDMEAFGTGNGWMGY